jgi:hypothetical protein
MHGHLDDRDPHHHIPAEFQARSKLWMASARNLVSENAPFICVSVENLMFTERFILQMEKTLARQDGYSPDPHEPWLLKECAAHSVLWLCGLYEVTRILKNAKLPKYPALDDLHGKLSFLRMPLAKGEVYRSRLAYYPTSIWCVETGRVGWHAFDPKTNSLEVYYRSDLADEFLAVAGTASTG